MPDEIPYNGLYVVLGFEAEDFLGSDAADLVVTQVVHMFDIQVNVDL